MSARARLRLAWAAALLPALAVRLWNALVGPLAWGYDAWGHLAYVLFLARFHGLPYADQGWSYFHPPLHYALGWLLAQSGDAVVLMRGMMLLASVASLGIAALAAWCVRRVSPGPSLLAPLAFAAVALLPVHLFVSAMPGNEMTVTALGAAAVCVAIANRLRPRPTLARDAAAGGLAGLALLAKFSGLVPAVTVVLLVAGEAARRDGWRGVVRRGGVVLGAALLVAGPWYARNVAAFGTPFRLSRDLPLVAEVERDQPPGSRGWRDYVAFAPRMFADPDVRAPHLLHAVWPSVYLNVWADVTRESDVAPTPASRRREARWFGAMAVLGLVPTLLAFAGAALALRDTRHGRRTAVYPPLLLLSALTLAAFAAFAWRVPQWSALKAAYLLGLSLPFGAFLARAIEALRARAVRPLQIAAGAALVAVAVGAVALNAEGMVLPRRADAPAAGAVYYAFGEHAAARALYTRLVAGSGALPWIENLAAVELADGHLDRARALGERALALAPPRGEDGARRLGRLAVALALGGAPSAARARLDAALALAPLPDLRANRGALALAQGEPVAAEVDLRAALDEEPELASAWWNLGLALAAQGRTAEAREAQARTARVACTAPRRHPYGLGTGEILEWGVGRRPLLVLSDGALALAGAESRQAWCAAGPT